jgi:hypothetical protein
MWQVVLFNVTNGLIIGAFYVLMALGLSLILNLSNVINFAHGGFLVIGGYIAYTITPYVGFWGALVIAPPLTPSSAWSSNGRSSDGSMGAIRSTACCSRSGWLSSSKTAPASSGAHKANP